MSSEFKEELNKIAERYSSYTGFNKVMEELAFRSMESYLKEGVCLDIGCADGYTTMDLVASNRFSKVIAVDGSSVQIEKIKSIFSGFKNINVVPTCSLAEELVLDEQVDTIVLNYVLEHVIDPVAVLLNLKKYLKPDGVMIIVVPNAESEHRRIAKVNGLIKSLHEFSEQDIHDGHRRVYNTTTLLEDIVEAWMHPVTIEGILFKPLPASEMEKLPLETIEYLYKYGRCLENTYRCSSIMVVCQAS